MGSLGVQTRIFIDFVWVLGSPWEPFWSRFSDFFVNWVTKWTAVSRVDFLVICERKSHQNSMLGHARTMVIMRFS